MSIDRKLLLRLGAQARLQQLQEEIESIRRGVPGALGESGTGRRGRRKMSAAARKRISEAQKRRWAKQKAKAKAS